jgi:hypothetical protein
MSAGDAGGSGRGVARKQRGGPQPRAVAGSRPHGPRLDEALAAAVARAFAALRAGSPPPAELSLDLRFTAIPGRVWRVEAVPPPEEQIRRAVREAVARRDVFRAGRIWCYRCESADCAHSLPPAPDRVFGGYGATGLPSWPRLPELLLQRRHPGVAALFGPASRAIAADFVSGADLTENQLEAFGRGSSTYAVLGQAVFGFLSLRPAADADAEAVRTAFTLQAVETRSARGTPRLDLNVVALTPDGSPAADALADPSHQRVMNIVSVARRRLRHLVAAPAGPRGAAARCAPALAGRAEAILRDAVRGLERLTRQAERRTRHAEGRGLERRPTAKAREDALAAQPESLLRDGRRGTVVVLGPGQRVHVFSAEGRHVTSLAMDADAVRRRRRLERWEPLDAAARAAFRAALEGRAGGDPYSPSPRSSSA